MSDDRAAVNVVPAPDVDQRHVICAWCKKVIHQGLPDAIVSHGFCRSDACRKAFESGIVSVDPATGAPEFIA